ncbi:hypothetical protein ACFE04_026785 [Oxalis oulophora]
MNPKLITFTRRLDSFSKTKSYSEDFTLEGYQCELKDPNEGYIVKDTIVVIVQVFVRMTKKMLHTDSTNEETSHICFDEIATTLFQKLEDDKAPYSVRLGDFKEITYSNYVNVGIFTVPETLESYAKHLLARHAIIGIGNSLVHYMSEIAFVVLCCAMKSMDTTYFYEITESLILKWRDAIKGALQFGFKVKFLKDHLKSIVQAYLARLARNSDESEKLQTLDDKITMVEKQLGTLKDKRADMYNKTYTKLRKSCEALETKFSGKTCASFLK